jgi:protocatechuate 3,4-dioxygenase alpha subunit
MTMAIATASQTIGPYWHLLEDASWADLTRFGATGAVITVEGHVRDGEGAAMTDACVEIWQSSPAASDIFPAFGRAATDGDGKFRFRTLMPEAVPGPGNSLQAPHIAVTVLARGLLYHLTTRLYFEGAAENENDPILALVEDPARRDTLIARQVSPGVWHFDLHLQGPQETVFFDI